MSLLLPLAADGSRLEALAGRLSMETACRGQVGLQGERAGSRLSADGMAGLLQTQNVV